jgi:hypothetical protein
VNKTIAGQWFCCDGKLFNQKHRLAKSYLNESFAIKSYADVAWVDVVKATKRAMNLPPFSPNALCVIKGEFTVLDTRTHALLLGRPTGFVLPHVARMLR